VRELLIRTTEFGAIVKRTLWPNIGRPCPTFRNQGLYSDPILKTSNHSTHSARLPSNSKVKWHKIRTHRVNRRQIAIIMSLITITVTIVIITTIVVMVMTHVRLNFQNVLILKPYLIFNQLVAMYVVLSFYQNQALNNSAGNNGGVVEFWKPDLHSSNTNLLLEAIFKSYGDLMLYYTCGHL
jgi:hypothetical protein